MISIFNITNILAKLDIKLPETFWKEEIVRYLTESDSRIVEIPLMFSNIPSSKKRILEIGCRYSLLSIQLSSLGHQVYGIDINNYKRKHPNFHFRKADILKSKYPQNYFDIVVSLSTIEHIGLGRYNDRKDAKGDIKTMKEIYRVIKPGGQVLITLPFGKPVDTDWYRVYNTERVRELLVGFKINKEYFFRDKNGNWMPTTIEDVENIDSSIKPMAIVFVKATKI
jgi:SAM-dependent methyltransferase